MRRTPYLDRNDKAAKFTNNIKTPNQKKISFDFRLPQGEIHQKNHFQASLLLNKAPIETDRKLTRVSPQIRRPMTGRNNYLLEPNFPQTMRYKNSKNFFEKKSIQNPDRRVQSISGTNVKQILTDKSKIEKNERINSHLQLSNEEMSYKGKLYRGNSTKDTENLRKNSSSFKKDFTPNQRYEQKKPKTPRGFSNSRDSKVNANNNNTKQLNLDSRKKIFDLLTKNNTSQKKQNRQKNQIYQSNQNTTNKDDFFFQYVLRFSYRSKKGYMPNNPNKSNQDSYIISPNINKKSWQHYFGICDGHGIYGHLVSSFIKNNLPLCISNMKNFQKNPKENLHKAFQITVKKLVGESHIDLSFSGSTVVGCYLLHNKLYCCNVGDSRSIIGQKNNQNKWIAKQLSIDHKPSLDKQAQRIIKNKGRVQSFRDGEGNSIGPLRVWLKEQNVPGLAMTRSFGDLVAASVGVTWQPQILEFTLTQNDRIILIASDGVWQFLTNEQIIRYLGPYYERNKIEQACDFLLELAHSKWTKQCSVIDDISFVLIFMNYNEGQ